MPVRKVGTLDNFEIKKRDDEIIMEEGELGIKIESLFAVAGRLSYVIKGCLSKYASYKVF